jgi:hypothetical protein
VVSRRGLGLHITFESSSGERSDGNVLPLPSLGSTRVEEPEISCGSGPDEPQAKNNNRKIVLLALGLAQGLVVVANEVFDLVGYLGLN